MLPVRDQFRLIDLACTPVEAAGQLRHLPGVVFFDSAQARPGAISIVAAGPDLELAGELGLDLDLLRKALVARAEPPGELSFPAGFAAGWIEYDGRFHFGFFDRLLVYAHDEGHWYGRGGLERELRVSAPAFCVEPIHFCHEQGASDFQARVRQAQEYIAAGDIYQVNLSQRFAANWGGDPWSIYTALRAASPAPYAAFLHLGGRAVLSSSPECFLEMRGREIRTRPIKGTRPRHHDPEEDARLQAELAASDKERAELVMITDLERNDLGQVCEYHSVRATELLKLERFEQVFHLVSTVEGRLRRDVDHLEALQACFPGGSITGAPKKRAREIIQELEPVERGLYTGAIGWFGFNGDSRFSIAIRTLLAEQDQLHFHTGAGIVADSDPIAEYEETLHKAAGILRATGAV